MFCARFRPLLMAAALVVSPGIFPGWSATATEKPFEGQVKMKISDGTAEHAIDYFVKGERMRVETGDPRMGGGAMIMDMSKKEILVLMPEQKMYMTMPMPDLPGKASADDESPQPKPTGEKRTILGHEAQQYRVEAEGTEFEVWATDELGTFAPMGLGQNERPGARSRTERALSGQDFFPLLIIERKNGREQSRVEVVEIDQKSLPASLFEPPSGFSGMQMPFQMRQ